MQNNKMPDLDLKSSLKELNARLDDPTNQLASSQNSIYHGLDELRNRNPDQTDHLLAMHLSYISGTRQQKICHVANGLNKERTEKNAQIEKDRRNRETRNQ